MITNDDVMTDVIHELGDLKDRVARMEAAVGATHAKLRPNEVPAEYLLEDGTVSYVFESARWVQKGDWIQAVHGDTEWREVLHRPVHTPDQTGIVTRRTDGTEWQRWWGNDDPVKVAEAPVPDPAAWR